MRPVAGHVAHRLHQRRAARSSRCARRLRLLEAAARGRTTRAGSPSSWWMTTWPAKLRRATSSSRKAVVLRRARAGSSSLKRGAAASPARCRIIDMIGVMPMPPAMNRKRVRRADAARSRCAAPSTARRRRLRAVSSTRLDRAAAARRLALDGDHVAVALAGSLHSEYLRSTPFGVRTVTCAPGVNAGSSPPSGSRSSKSTMSVATVRRDAATTRSRKASSSGCRPRSALGAIARGARSYRPGAQAWIDNLEYLSIGRKRRRHSRGGLPC